MVWPLTLAMSADGAEPVEPHPNHCASTTIPGPSSIEEEGRRKWKPPYALPPPDPR